MVSHCVLLIVIVLTGLLLFLTYAMSTNWLTRIAIK